MSQATNLSWAEGSPRKIEIENSNKHIRINKRKKQRIKEKEISQTKNEK